MISSYQVSSQYVTVDSSIGGASESSSSCGVGPSPNSSFGTLPLIISEIPRSLLIFPLFITLFYLILVFKIIHSVLGFSCFDPRSTASVACASSFPPAVSNFFCSILHETLWWCLILENLIAKRVETNFCFPCCPQNISSEHSFSIPISFLVVSLHVSSCIQSTMFSESFAPSLYLENFRSRLTPSEIVYSSRR
jgi:hypothetical protein